MLLLLLYVPDLFHTVVRCFLPQINFQIIMWISTSDESEPSWLEPGLELNNFQLGSARLVNFSAQLENFSI